MTGISHRVAGILRAKANRVLDEAEDPREALDEAHRQAQAELVNARRGLVEMAAARQRVVAQDQGLAQQEARLSGQAQRAVNAGRDDLAREALTRQAQIRQQRAPIQEQLKQLAEQEEGLRRMVSELGTRVTQMGTQKEVLKAQYEAGKAAVAVHESLTGVGTHMEDIGGAFNRAQEKIQGVQARASALDELVNDGSLGTVPGISAGDPLDDELNQIDLTAGIDDALAAMKQRSLPTRTPPPALPAGPSVHHPVQAPQLDPFDDEPDVKPGDDGSFDFTKM